MTSKISSKLIFASCVWYSDRRAYYWVCVLINDIGRRLPLELQRSLYQDNDNDIYRYRTEKPKASITTTTMITITMTTMEAKAGAK